MNGELELHGMEKLIASNKDRILSVQRLAELGPEFVGYMESKRFPAQWRNKGRIPGPYGGGSSNWPANMPSTIKAKGHNRVLFHNPVRSDLLFGLRVSFRTVRGYGKRPARFEATITATKEYAEYLHNGRSDMVPRDIFTFYPGDAKWLVNRAAKIVVEV